MRVKRINRTIITEMLVAWACVWPKNNSTSLHLARSSSPVDDRWRSNNFDVVIIILLIVYRHVAAVLPWNSAEDEIEIVSRGAANRLTNAAIASWNLSSIANDCALFLRCQNDWANGLSLLPIIIVGLFFFLFAEWRSHNRYAHFVKYIRYDQANYH